MPVPRLESERTRDIENSLEIQIDGGARFLRYFIFNRQVEIVRAILQAFERALILRQHRGTDPRNIVEINPAQRQVTQILTRCHLDSAELRKVWLVRPA